MKTLPKMSEYDIASKIIREQSVIKLGEKDGQILGVFSNPADRETKALVLEFKQQYFKKFRNKEVASDQWQKDQLLLTEHLNGLVGDDAKKSSFINIGRVFFSQSRDRLSDVIKYPPKLSSSANNPRP